MTWGDAYYERLYPLRVCHGRPTLFVGYLGRKDAFMAAPRGRRSHQPTIVINPQCGCVPCTPNLCFYYIHKFSMLGLACDEWSILSDCPMSEESGLPTVCSALKVDTRR